MLCCGILLALAAFFLLDWLTLALRGDCDLYLNAERLENAVRVRNEDRLCLRVDIPLENRSLKEQGILVGASAELVPYNKEARLNQVWVRLARAESPRADGYFEAVLVKPGKAVQLRVEILGQGTGTVKDLLERERLHLDLSYTYYGRKPMATERARFSVPVSSFVEKGANEEVSGPTPVRQAEKPYVVPLRTHLILPGEDLGKVVLRYAGDQARPGDWVALAESVVAIAQGRVYPVTQIRPGFWARRLNRLFHYDSSMASCYSMELAIREAGLWRILLAVAAGLLGRLLGRRADFYRVAGRGVASIDDCTGTLPPFDKSVVLGPRDPSGLAEEILQATGLEVAVVDANDLQRVDVLGHSSGIIVDEVVEALRDNPQGNADEQTPIVLIRRKSSG